MKRHGLVGPIIIIFVGIVLLINSLGFDPPIGLLLRSVWPFLLIAIGAVHVFRHFHTGFIGRPGTLTGGIIMITLGTLFALQQLAEVSFRSTWPLLLIATGVGLLLQFAGTDGALGRWQRGNFRR